MKTVHWLVKCELVTGRRDLVGRRLLVDFDNRLCGTSAGKLICSALGAAKPAVRTPESPKPSSLEHPQVQCSHVSLHPTWNGALTPAAA